jgi:YbgC/YbaW family acyl-CoA thioester hydrolase
MENGFVMRRRVEFMDTDMAGIVHLTAYFRYMETVEHELFRSLGLSITSQQSDRHLGWPRVSCGFNFINSLRFEDEFEIHFGVARIGDSSVTYETEVIRDGNVLARGYSTSVCCEIGPDGKMCSANIPDDIAEKLKQYKVASTSKAARESIEDAEDQN